MGEEVASIKLMCEEAEKKSKMYETKCRDLQEGDKEQLQAMVQQLQEVRIDIRST